MRDGTIEGRTRRGPIAFASGLATGVAAGLVGVGGGEFRMPVLLRLLGLPVRIAAAANLLVGLFVVALSAARRWGQEAPDRGDLLLGLVMAAASLAGASIGATYADRIDARLLRRIVRGYLIAVGAWMVVESVLRVDHVLFDPGGPWRWIMGGLVGFLISGASGVLGVAGGEMRIPALIYGFGLPVRAAGTISLLVSIPTVAAGTIAYRRLGHLPGPVARLALIMAGGSLVGVLAGVAGLPLVDTHVLKGILGAILLLAALSLGAREGELEPVVDQ